MSDNLSIQNSRIEFAQCESLPLPWWQGMQRDQGKSLPPLVLTAATFPKGASVEECRAAAALQWDAVAVTPHYSLPQPDIVGPDGEPISQPPRLMIANDHRLIVRNDTGAVLGQASAGYKVHTMTEILAHFRKLCDTAHGGGWRIVTLGALCGGAIIWAQAQRDETAEILPGHTVAHQLVFFTSFDGSKPTGCNDSTTVVVCNNTLDMSMQDRNAKHATQRHRSKFDGDSLTRRAGINTGSDAWTRTMEAWRILADTSVTDGQARDILNKLLRKGDGEKVATPKASKFIAPAEANNGATEFAQLLNKPVQSLSIGPGEREHRNVQPIMELFQGNGHGADTAGYQGTRYGLLQSVTEFVDHQSGRTWDTGKTSAMFGIGAKLKSQAFEMIAADTPAAALFA